MEMRVWADDLVTVGRIKVSPRLQDPDIMTNSKEVLDGGDFMLCHARMLSALDNR
jgi:hypothetical protein